MSAMQAALGDNRGPWIQTYSGRQFWPLAPRAEDLDIADIAHALANIPHWNGHTSAFYSVAQHSLHVSFLCPPELALWGLLHDASEAYIGDMSRPLKLAIPYFQRIEQGIQYVIAERFGLVWPEPAAVKAADNRSLATEARDLLPGGAIGWDPGPSDLNIELLPQAPGYAEFAFLARFEALTGGTR